MKIHRGLTATLLTCSVAIVTATSGLKAAEGSKRVDPQALGALKRMSATLAEAKAFTYKSSNIIEVPAKTGQFVTLFPTTYVAMQRPDRLKVRIGGGAPAFDFYYDGKTAAAWAPGTKTYSTAKAPATTDAMLAGLEAETGIRFVTAPLLFSNPYNILSKSIYSGVVVGKVVVRGVECEHLAFRSSGVNWEIWVTTGPTALPRRLAVTFTDRPNFPRTLVEFSAWDLHPWLGSSEFTFRAPAGSHEVPFLSQIKSEAR